MEEKKITSIRMKIFLASVLIFLSVLLGLYTYNIVTVNKEYISTETKSSTNCLSLGFEVIDVKYENNILSFTIKNSPSSNGNIKSVSVDNNGEVFTQEVVLSPSRSQRIIFEEFFGADFAYVYPNDCDKFAKPIPINIS